MVFEDGQKDIMVKNEKHHHNNHIKTKYRVSFRGAWVSLWSLAPLKVFLIIETDSFSLLLLHLP